MRYSTGRDHLGMQATSVATYSYLVPGLTNLTQRARYYSYYPWLVEQYAKEVHSTGISEFNKFIRRGELLFAFVSILNDQGQRGIVGSRFVKSYIRDYGIPRSGTAINLAEFADIAKGKKTYWQLRGGGFAQYYLGPLADIGLLSRSKNHDIPIVTDAGRTVALNFGKSIGSEAETTILSSIKKGSIKYSDIEKYLTVIMPNQISATGQEAKNLLRHLIPDVNDKNGQNRRETILAFINYLDQDRIADQQYDLPKAIYYREGNNKNKIEFVDNVESLYGWRFYQINEYVHYALEYVFFYLLQILHDDGGWIPIKECVEKIKKEAFDEINNILPRMKNIKQTMKVGSLARILKSYKNIPRRAKGTPDWLIPSEDFAEKNLAKALLLLMVMYVRHEDEVHELYEYGRKTDILREGSFLDIFAFFQSETSTTLESFFSKLVYQKVVRKHLEVSYRKMSGDEKNTLKFQFDNNSLSGLEIVYPVLTSPRLTSVLNFLRDLGLVSLENKPTANGLRILNGRA